MCYNKNCPYRCNVIRLPTTTATRCDNRQNWIVDRDEDRRIQRIGQQRMQLLSAAPPGWPDCPLRERVCNVLVVCDMRLPLLQRRMSPDHQAGGRPSAGQQTATADLRA